MLRCIQQKLTKSDRRFIRLAFEMAVDAHKDMRRKSGEPYILHPLAVAQIVAKEIGLGSTAVICALLHDVVEDTELTLEDIEREFGKKIAKIIDGLTKISGVLDLSSSLQAENFRKLLLTLTDDVRVILIKMADRLHNMRTLDSVPRHKQLKIASETSYLYAPLAHRLGLYAIKTELEDLSLKFTEREVYREIATKLNQTKRERSKYINEFIKPLKDGLVENTNLDFEIYGRPKSIHSIYSKMKSKSVTFEEVYDLFAIRVILDSPPEREKSDCWNVYSKVTDIYRPNPDRLRDWISTPKANGYEALHTTVMGPKGRWVEVQIRTKRMNEIAEKGYAAHWKYKEGAVESRDSSLDDWLLRIREILQNQDSNALDFINDFKLNLYSDEIYVFTPQGDLKMLPKSATALDFAFEIHTDLGVKCIGAKVNHKLVPLSYELSNGDQVEIITSKKQKPNEDWLNFVVTGKARSKIKSSLKEEKRTLAKIGEDYFNKRLKQLKVKKNSSVIQEFMSYFKMTSPLDFYYNIAIGRISKAKLESLKYEKNKLIDPEVKEKAKIDEVPKEVSKAKIDKHTELLIFDESADKIEYKFASCCKPIPGDDVFGFITINEGIKIHKTNCPNAIKLMSSYGHRIVKTKWTKQQEIAFLTELLISGIDDMGVMNRMTSIISGELKINMRSISVDSKDGIFEGRITVFVNDTDQLEALIIRLRELEGVLSVSRRDY